MSSSIINKIGIENLLNAILVNEDVRPAMLFQDNDYENKETVKIILKEIKKLFPNLIHSTSYQTYQGVIISKIDYNKKNITLEKMGEILGYPCHDSFMNIDRNNDDIYGIDILVDIKNNPTISLFSNICPNTSKINEFNDFAEVSKIILNLPKYSKILSAIEITNVYIDVNFIPCLNSIINKLISNEQINDVNYINSIENAIWNIGFNDQQFNEIKSLINYNNHIHKGIIIYLLVETKNDKLSPFFPLYNYPHQFNEVTNITLELGKSLIDVLKKTSNSYILSTTIKKKCKQFTCKRIKTSRIKTSRIKSLKNKKFNK